MEILKDLFSKKQKKVTRYFKFIKNNGELYYFYLPTHEDINKDWSYINFMDELEMIENFTTIGTGLFRADNKPIVNNTLTKKSCYIADCSIGDCIKSYMQLGNLIEISYHDYCYAMFMNSVSMSRKDILEVFKGIVNNPLWDKNCQEKLRKLYIEMMND